MLGSSRGLGHHPFTVETRIRIPYRLHYFNLIFILNMYDELRARRIIIVNTLCNKAIKGESIEEEVNDLEVDYTYGTKQVAKGTIGICNPISVATEGTYTAGDKYECDVDQIRKDMTIHSMY